jgi:predicted XRE-type DNA-binding protein
MSLLEDEKMKHKNIGSSLDDFLSDEGLLEDAEATAVKRVIAYQLQQEIKNKHITKVKLAESMNTSRAQLDRLLDPGNTSVTLHTLMKAATVLGKKVKLELV